MPKVRRAALPVALLRHLNARVRQREITGAQLLLLAQWLDANPEVPSGKWFRRFPEMTVCGEGELIKTFLRLGQVADGEEII
jgi:hypothetical protein